MSLANLVQPWVAVSYGFLDESAKREIRRALLKAIAIPGYQVPYASREVPIARGWGTGGLQVTLTLVRPDLALKVIDQGADDSVNAVNLRRFVARVASVAETTDALLADIIQSRHRIPEERLAAGQVLVLQVPDPEPLRRVEPDISTARIMHGDADYGRMWLRLYEQIVLSGRITQGASYPSLVNGRHIISPSPIPRWDVQKLNMAHNLTFLSAGREKRIYAVPPFTRVEPLVFDDVPYEVEDHAGLVCHRSGVSGFFMNEIPLDDGSSAHELSDSDYAVKRINARDGHPVTIGDTWYKNGRLEP
ncbi:alpha-D-ribose 1-methylphosphonate 5-phosphate C-P lyase [Bradyrhizobium sp. USDA 4369]